MRFTGAALLFCLVGCATAGQGSAGDDDDDDPNLPGENPQEGQATLTVVRQGTGVGAITSSPPGIDCGETCTANFDADAVVTLTATPTTGTTFMGWSGGGCSGTATCSATPGELATINAMFSCDPGSITFEFTGAAQTFVPAVCVTSITVDAFGAQGGKGDDLGTGAKPGGLGARIQGAVPITAAGVTVIVGGLGASQANGHGGGGGASWVFANATDATPLIVAGGGGGASSNSNGGCTPGPGSATTDATASVQGAGNSLGGAAGTGGAGGAATSFQGGGGGAGWIADGATGGGGGGAGGRAPRNGAAGGASAGGAAGGFGGGGSGFGTSGACGGGGGFNGGGGGNGWNGSAWGCGGGGGSFNASAAPTNTAGARAGNGQVTLTW